MANDGSLIFNTKIDTNGFENDADKVSSKFVKLKNSIANTEAEISRLTQELEEMANTPVDSGIGKKLERDIERAKIKLNQLYAEADRIGNAKQANLAEMGLGTENLDEILGRDDNWQKVQSQIDSAEAKLRQYEAELQKVRNAEANTSGKDTAEYKKKQQRIAELNRRLEVYQAQLRETQQKEKSAGKQTSKTTGYFKKLTKSLKNVFTHTKKTNSQMGLFGKLSMQVKQALTGLIIYRVLSSALQSVKEGLDNLAKASPNVNKNLSALMSSLTYLKNSLATAFAPILNIITPILTGFMDTISAVTNKVANFIAVLTGQNSYQKAIKVQQDYAESLEDTAKEADKATKNLASFDELNVMQDDTSTADSSKETESYFETVPTVFDNFANKLKKTFQKGDFKSIGKLVADKLNSAMKSIRWNKIRSTAKIWAKNIANFLNGAIDKFNWRLAGKTFANSIKTAIDFAYTFLKEFDWKNLGYSFIDFAGGFFKSFDIKIPVSKFKRAIDSLVKSFKNIHKNFLKPLAKWTIKKAIPVAVNLLADAFVLLGKAFKIITSAGGISVLLGISSAIFAFKSYTMVSGIITGITASIKGLGTVLTNLSTGNVIGFTVTALAGLVTALKAYHDINFQNSSIGQEVEKLKTMNSELQTISDSINNTIDEANAKVTETGADVAYLDELQEKLRKIIEDGTISAEEQAEAKTIVSLLKEQVPDFEETWNTLVTTDEQGNLKMQEGAQKTTEALEKIIETRKREIMQNALAEIITETYKEYFQKQREIQEIKDSDVTQSYEQAQAREKELTDEINTLLGEQSLLMKDINDLKKKREAEGLDNIEKATLERLTGAYDDSVIKLQNYYDEQSICYDTMRKLGGEYETYEEKLKTANTQLNKLKNTTDTYNGYLDVMNGNYDDLSSVYGAYENGLIDEATILKNTAKTAEKLNTEMKGTGDEAVKGYLNALREGAKGTTAEAAGLAEKTWEAWREQDEIHSPSKKYEAIGKDDIAGFVKAFSKDKTAIKTVSNFAQNIAEKINGIFNSIKLSLQNLPSYFRKVFKSSWLNTKTVLNNYFIPGFEKLINSVNNSLNDTLESYNKSVGGKIGNLITLPTLENTRIPRLATGTVVPASYGEFLAVLDDNKRETEVVSPLSTIKQAVAEVIAGMGGVGGNQEITVICQVDRDVLFKQVVKANNQDKKRRGKSVLF